MKTEVKADVVERTEGSNPECVKQAEKPGRGEYSGHHRGLRPWHAFMGEIWELERANCLLVQYMVSGEDSEKRTNLRRAFGSLSGT